MNKAITAGIQFMPTAFEEGLDVWSSGDGTAGSDTYENTGDAAFVPADQDFGGCLEVLKSSSTQKLRYMGRTPILPGCYLRVRARIKAVSGALPSVRIAGWAGKNNDVHVGGLVEAAPQVSLTAYGEVVEVMAIIGSGNRPGVDMIWGQDPEYGYFGLDLLGPNGGTVRIDDIVIEDITSVFLRDMMAWVDVRDYGAKGDGVTNDLAAFQAADAVANGRMVMVPAGVYFLADSLALQSRVRFEGTVTMPVDKILSLTRDFDLPSYIEAFGNEELAFRKAFQALLNNADHASLDLGGRRVGVTGPIDMQAAVPNKGSYATRRLIHNGQLECIPGPNWDTVTVTSQATYSTGNPLKLTNVANVANIAVGSHITASGVGREVYVRDRNIGAGEITLSQPLYDAAGTQTYTFRRFQYLLDFSGFSRLDKFEMADIEFQCWGECSAILLPPTGVVFQLRDCFITRPRDRGITSIGRGCQDMLIDRCQFLSSEIDLPAQQRSSIAINVNANDTKIRDNRFVRFAHFMVANGGGHIISGNHWFQGDGSGEGLRYAGLVLTLTNVQTTITGNYIDNASIEWTNEREPEPDFSGGFGFAGLSVTGNVFLSSNVAPWFSFLVVKPYGSGQFVNGLNVSGNTFRCVGTTMNRVERVDTSFSGLDFARMKKITFVGNTYHNIEFGAENPLVVAHSQNTPEQVWEVSTDGRLPFNGYALDVDAVALRGRLRNESNVSRYDNPHTETRRGPAEDEIHLTFSAPMRGDVNVTMRMD